MSRNRLPAVVVVALAIVALLLWWLLGGGTAGPGSAGVDARTAVPALDPTSGRSLEATAPASSPPKGPGGGKRDPAKPDGEADASAKPEVAQERSQGIAVLEDGTPLPGVLVWEWEDFDVEVAQDAFIPNFVEVRSDAAGAFTTPRGPVRVGHPHADLVAAEGAAVLPVKDAKEPNLRVDSDRVRLIFRDRPGTAHVRLLDAATGTPVTNVAGLRLSWVFEGGALVVHEPRDPGLGGWIPVAEGKLPQAEGGDASVLRIDPAKVTLEIAVPGWEKGSVPLPEVHGRREIRVDAVVPDVRGNLDTGPLGVTANRWLEEGSGVVARLRSLDPEPRPVPEDLQGLPTVQGPFALFGLSDGSWELEVAVTWNGETIRAKTAVEKHGAPVDLGTITIQPSGRVVVRVLDAAEREMPQAFVIAVRPDENPDQGRPLYPDKLGLVTLSDLEPGVDHRVQVRGLPRLLEQTVRAAAGADAKAVEFRWPEKAVACRITLAVDGKAVASADGSRTVPASIHESPLPRDKGAWNPDGTFEARLVPGTYRFSAYATPKEGGGMALFAGEVTVPSGETFETRLEMVREP